MAEAETSILATSDMVIQRQTFLGGGKKPSLAEWVDPKASTLLLHSLVC